MYEQIRKNKQKTFLVLFTFILLVAAVGLAFNYLLGYGVAGVIIAIIVAIFMSFFLIFIQTKLP